jgi:carboxylesterase type B
VYSTSGTIIGHQAPDRPDTFEFLGIKYGQAPIGELRFAPPERYIAPAHNLYNASTWVSFGYTSGRV